MRYRLITFSTLLFFAVLSSCHDDNVSFYPKTYYSRSFEDGQMLLVTKGNEIKDTTKIRSFCDFFNSVFSDIYSSWTNVSLDRNINCFDKFNFKLKMLSTSKAIMISDTDSVTLTVERKDNVLYFFSNDTVKTYYDVSNEVLRYKPLYIKTYTISYTKVYDHVPCMYAYEINNEIHFPVISYINMKHLRGGYFSTSWSEGINNSINTDFIKNIGNDCETDTIAFREGKIIFK